MSIIPFPDQTLVVQSPLGNYYTIYGSNPNPIIAPCNTVITDPVIRAAVFAELNDTGYHEDEDEDD